MWPPKNDYRTHRTQANDYGILDMISDAKNPKNRPKREVRDEKGRFGAGHSGRPKGARNKSTQAALALLDEKTEALTAVCIEKALDGDMAALRLCMERIVPVVKDRPVNFDLPDGLLDLEQATQAGARVLEAMAAGSITPREAGDVMAILSKYTDMVYMRDIEEQLEAIKNQDTKGRTTWKN